MIDAISDRPKLGRRFRYDRRPARPLNEIQLEAKASIERKIGCAEYRFEEVPCAICGGDNFDLLSEKDRYGLWLPVQICRDCGLIQTNPRMDEDSYARFYDSEYRRLYRGTEAPSEQYVEERAAHGKAIYEYLFGESGVLPEPDGRLTVVEVGCGGGGILKHFRDRGHEEFGLDPGSQYVEFSREAYDLNLHVGTLADAPDGLEADLVVYSHVFEHIVDPVEELGRIRRVLRPDGILYVEVPGVKNLHRTYGLDFLQFVQNAHVHHFTLATLRALVESHGFRFVAGDETIRSVFRPGDAMGSEPSTEYHDVLRYLRNLRLRRGLLGISMDVYHTVRRIPFIGPRLDDVVRRLRGRGGRGGSSR